MILNAVTKPAIAVMLGSYLLANVRSEVTRNRSRQSDDIKIESTTL